MTDVLLMALRHRQRYGIENIGWESLLVIILYCNGLAIALVIRNVCSLNLCAVFHQAHLPSYQQKLYTPTLKSD
jgi:hypothetical protein